MKTIVDENKIKKIKVGDIEIAYEVFGEKPDDRNPIILITGYRATMDMWAPGFIENLANDNQVIVFDNRGMGMTSAGEKEFSMEQFARDTAGLVKALGIKKINVLGWSMGTNIAQEMILHFPELVDRLILYATDCGGDQCIMPSDKILSKMTDTSGSFMEQGQRLLGLMFPVDWFQQHPNPMDYFPIPFEETDPDNIEKQTQALEKWKGTFQRINQVENPVLLLTGTEDLMTPPQNSLLLAEKIPHSWLVRIKHAGHGLMYQFPKETARIIDSFIEHQG
ncbi:MAG: alpha/beta fold hydrolase [Vulcanimicrobiota bacterium]